MTTSLFAGDKQGRAVSGGEQDVPYREGDRDYVPARSSQRCQALRGLRQRGGGEGHLTVQSPKNHLDETSCLANLYKYGWLSREMAG